MVTASMFYILLLFVAYQLCNNYGYLHVISCSPGSPIGCGAPPTLATGVTGEYNGTTVSSVIVYQCQQSGFIPSAPSSVCGENGRWSPDPSQVVCVQLPGLSLRFPATTVELKQYCKTLTFLQMFSIYILILFRWANKCRLMLSLLPFCSQLHCLWGSFLFLWSDCWAIQQYHSCLRVSLPVSTRVSTRGKEDIAVWGRWKVEPWPSESLYRYKY